PYHNHQFADRSFFIVNPLGTQFARLGGGRATKLEWEGEWKSAARIVADGWTAELAVPWRILNYPNRKGPTEVGINFDRYQARTRISSWWSNVGQPERNELDGHWKGVELPAFRPQFSALPYVSPGWGEDGGETLHSGLDLRYTLSPMMTLVGTINPDFRNVESAVEGIDFSYGERFVPDRRPFFQEGSEIYGIGGAAGRYFHSGRIPDFDTGLNLYGRVTERDTIGTLAALNFGTRADWIMRGRHEFGPASTADVAFINRDGERGKDRDGNPIMGSNRVLVLRQGASNRRWSMGANWATSWVDGQPKGSAGNSTFAYSTSRWYAHLNPRFVRPEFTDDLGYIPFKGFKGIGGLAYYRREWRSGPLVSFNAGVDTNDDRHTDGSLFRRQRAVFTGMRTRSDYFIGAGWRGGRFNEFDDSVFNLNLGARASNPFHNYGIGFSWGREGGERTTFLTPYVTWRFGEKLTLGLSSAILNRSESRQQHIFTFNHDFSPGRGIGGRIIAQTGGTGGYLSFRRSGYGGVESYVILGDPNAKKFRQRIVMKTVWPL
ncbi:MAG: hypothetical protein KY468_18315, partial [Armatimonadetes bacterium]|nr:hypothetical protein [Armatimonadota bacterium]